MIFVVFAALQVLDALTTAIFLKLGVAEANVIVNILLKYGTQLGMKPYMILLLFKFIPVTFIMYPIYDKYKDVVPVSRINLVFKYASMVYFGIVIWNCLAIMTVLGVI